MPKILSSEHEILRAKENYAQWFGDAANIPVSFCLGGKQYKGFDADFAVEREALPAGTQVSTDFDGLRDYISLSDYGEKITAKHCSGVTVIVKTAVYEAYGAIEWTAYFRNDGEENSPILSDVLALDTEFAGDSPCLEHFIGDDSADPHALQPQMLHLGSGIAVEFQPYGGRPTSHRQPFYRLSAGEETVLLSVGWSGQWKARFDAVLRRDCVRFTAGQAEFRAYLKPGESIRTPMMTLLFADGRVEEEEAHLRMINLWRRFLIDCNMRRADGELMKPVSSANTAYLYTEMTAATEQNQIDAIRVYRENGVELDYWWMDAGWYTRGDGQSLEVGGWWPVGNWEVDKRRFPTGFKAVTDYAAQTGTKTLLWFEPERFAADSYMGKMPEDWHHDDTIVDMGNPEARAWIQDRVFFVLDEGGFSLYRQDHNEEPVWHWRRGDAKQGPDRCGISENRHVSGYLAYWDALIAHDPKLWIDSCAGGGRRNDLESLRRSIAIHKTDACYHNFTQKQAMHLTDYQLLPYFGTPVFGWEYKGTVDDYALRTAHIPWWAFTYDVLNPNEELFALTRRSQQEWKAINGYFYGDFYPLTGWTNDEEHWIGWQFWDEEKKGGMVQLYRRENCAEASRVFKLHGLEAEKSYLVQDFDGETAAMTGAQLMQDGLAVTIRKKPGAALIKITEA